MKGVCISGKHFTIQEKIRFPGLLFLSMCPNHVQQTQHITMAMFCDVTQKLAILERMLVLSENPLSLYYRESLNFVGDILHMIVCSCHSSLLCCFGLYGVTLYIP